MEDAGRAIKRVREELAKKDKAAGKALASLQVDASGSRPRTSSRAKDPDSLNPLARLSVGDGGNRPRTSSRAKDPDRARSPAPKGSAIARPPQSS